jgi:hypothetical protein
MSLATFCFYLAGCYLAYYGVVLLADLLLRKRPGSSSSSSIDYTLSAVPREPPTPVRVGLENSTPVFSSQSEPDAFELMDNLSTDLQLETISDEGIEVVAGSQQSFTSKPYNS